MLQRESATSHQELEQLRQEMASLQPLYSPTAPQDSDLWKLQMEVSFIKGSRFFNRTHTHQCIDVHVSYSVMFYIQ